MLNLRSNDWVRDYYVTMPNEETSLMHDKLITHTDKIINSVFGGSVTVCTIIEGSAYLSLFNTDEIARRAVLYTTAVICIVKFIEFLVKRAIRIWAYFKQRSK